VNGRWLMRDRQITCLDEKELLRKADEYARQIDAFLIQREKSVLSKLIAIGGTVEEESFEVQAKVRVPGPQTVLAALQNPGLEILRTRHYHEFDTYFLFADPELGTLRYREDEFIDANGQVSQARYRLTLIGTAREHHFRSDVLLSRSRYLAPATYSMRFYREYFKPVDEVSIEKDRQRWRVLFRGTEFYINLDRLDHPDLGYFVEVKSRTWSHHDAEHKAIVAEELLEFLSASQSERVTLDYLDLARAPNPGV
jgi:5-methylthioadenosine/S-adenosylhomocysteine deaminase